MRLPIDHLLIAVPSLDEGMAAARELGFEPVIGGRHPAHGTANAIVTLGDSEEAPYLELITVADQAVARTSPTTSALIGASGWVGFALRGAGLDQVGRSLEDTGFAPTGPVNGQRMRPDGGEVTWRTLLLANGWTGSHLPFVIEWTSPLADRFVAGGTPGQPNGAHGIVDLTIAAQDVERATRELATLAVALGDTGAEVQIVAAEGRLPGPVHATIGGAGADQELVLLGAPLSLKGLS